MHSEGAELICVWHHVDMWLPITTSFASQTRNIHSLDPRKHMQAVCIWSSAVYNKCQNYSCKISIVRASTPPVWRWGHACAGKPSPACNVHPASAQPQMLHQPKLIYATIGYRNGYCLQNMGTSEVKPSQVQGVLP
jgi:hypothetical protein